MRQDIAVKHSMIVQMFNGVQLPYTPEFFAGAASESIMLACQFRRKNLFDDKLLNKVLNLFQRPLIATFMTLCLKSPELLFEFA